MRLFPWLLLVAGVCLYANSLNGRFVFDDALAITSNEAIRTLRPPWSPPGPNPVAGRPVVGFTLALNHALGGLDVRGYHAVNIAIHLLGALALYGVVRRTLLGPGLGVRFESSAGGLAFATALLWMVHPVQTECVNYILQRTESIMALFYLLTLYCAIRAGTEGGRLWPAASVISCALAMASKETAVTAPFMIVLYDWAYRSEAMRQVLRRRYGLYAGLAATWGILAVLMAGGPRSDSVGFSLGVSAWSYALAQCVAIVDYLRLVVWPGRLLLDYGVPKPLTPWQVAPYAAILLALLAATAVLLARRPRLGYPAAWFFVILAPTSSIVPITTEVAAERRIYLPLAGLAALAVVGSNLILERALGRAARPGADVPARARRVGAGLMILLAVPMVVTTWRRNATYRRPIALWQGAVEALPGNDRAHLNLGAVLEAAGRRDEAINSYRRAVQLNPASAHNNHNLGNALAATGRLTEGVGYLRTAVSQDPDAAVPRYGLGLSLAMLGSFEEAIPHFEVAVRSEPDDVNARWALAKSLAACGRLQEAIQHLRHAMRLAPRRPEFLRDAAWILATSPAETARDAKEALRLAEAAAALTPGEDAVTLDVLAAACAEAGDFERARASATRAIAAAEAQRQPGFADQIRARLALYNRNQAYHSQPPAGRP